MKVFRRHLHVDFVGVAAKPTLKTISALGNSWRVAFYHLRQALLGGPSSPLESGVTIVHDAQCINAGL